MNGTKTKTTLAIIYIISSASFLVIKEVAVPIYRNIAGGGNSALQTQVAINTKRLDLIEEFNIGIGTKVDSLLAGQASRNESIANLKGVADRIEAKLDVHLGVKK